MATEAQPRPKALGKGKTGNLGRIHYKGIVK